METRPTIMTLVDHESFYGTKETIIKAVELIKNIPSRTLINYISGLAVNCFLNDNIDSGLVQAKLIDIFISKAGQNVLVQWRDFLEKFVKKQHVPVAIWGYGNLLFYDLIFTHWNDYTMRDIDEDEAEQILKTYLILNSIANDQIKAEKLEEHKMDDYFYEEYIVPEFLPQRDYSSTSDYTNQVVRGSMLFNWLENDHRFKMSMPDYYKQKGISGWQMMFKNLMTLFTEINIGETGKQRNQLADLRMYTPSEITVKYLQRFSINSRIPSYQSDKSFSELRQHATLSLDDYNYFILDVNFLIDQFYKAQVFDLNTFFLTEGIDKEFLSTKAKEFMEDIYLRKLMDRCFPNHIKHYGDTAINSNKEEMTDFYLRKNSAICLMEFKDVMLASAAKNSSDKDKLYNAIDLKFKRNQKGKAKGITQLVNAIADIENNDVAFDNTDATNTLIIFPIVLYTDHSFGIDSLNRRYERVFRSEINNLHLKKLTVKPLVLVNLNTFELNETLFSYEQVDFFTVLEAFYIHVNKPDYENTPFETFFRFYLNEKNVPVSSISPEFNRVVTEIINYHEV